MVRSGFWARQVLARLVHGRVIRMVATASPVMAAATVVTLLGAAPASAHATLIGSTPRDGATMTHAPARVVLRFDENIRSPSLIKVTGPSGLASHGRTSVVDNTATVAVTLRPRSADVGRYTVAYRVVSADGHPVAGETAFTYHPAGVTAGGGATSSSSGATVHHHQHGGSNGWLVGGIAVAVLLVGLLVLTGRRRPTGGGRS